MKASLVLALMMWSLSAHAWGYPRHVLLDDANYARIIKAARKEPFADDRYDKLVFMASSYWVFCDQLVGFVQVIERQSDRVRVVRQLHPLLVDRQNVDRISALFEGDERDRVRAMLNVPPQSPSNATGPAQPGE